MWVNNQKKNEFWNHFVAEEFLNKTYPQITGSKLRKIKDEIFDWDFFWQDVIVRHGGNDETNPEGMKEDDKSTYDHCQGNFWGMIHQKLVEKGLIK